MTRRGVYHPKPLFSFLPRFDPVEVEILGEEPNGCLRIRYPLPKNSILAIMAKLPDSERETHMVERIVNAADVAPLPAAHRWSGWPGAWCLDCGIEDPSETCIATNPECACANQSGPCQVVCPPCPGPGTGSFDPYKKGSE